MLQTVCGCAAVFTHVNIDNIRAWIGNADQNIYIRTLFTVSKTMKFVAVYSQAVWSFLSLVVRCRYSIFVVYCAAFCTG